MDALETKTIIEQALRDPRNFPFTVYGIIFIVAAIGAYIGVHLRRKGQNFADKEDIKKLTENVESVRSQYAKDLENLAHENRKVREYFSQKHQLSLACIDRRLAAHQSPSSRQSRHFDSSSDVSIIDIPFMIIAIPGIIFK
jgi:ElaB/YqjD/DUF883 family membrane-anchored ribosome-binding protein